MTTSSHVLAKTWTVKQSDEVLVVLGWAGEQCHAEAARRRWHDGGAGGGVAPTDRLLSKARMA